MMSKIENLKLLHSQNVVHNTSMSKTAKETKKAPVVDEEEAHAEFGPSSI